MTLFDELENAGLPVISATEGGQIEMGPMNEVQYEQYSDVLLAYFQPVEHQKKTDRQLVIDSIDAFIISSGLVNQHISNINSNAEINSLFQLLCYKANVCDSGGTIRLSTYTPPPPMQNQPANNK